MVQLYADLGQRVVVSSINLPWIDSPSPGVQRRMLERDGDEVGRATSLVCYAPGCQFSAHLHGGGEEFLVLDGVFSDDYGDYPTGTYVRNPVGSKHAPFSREGCTIFVKLWQMHPDDQKRVVINTQQTRWLPGLVKGLEVMPLYSYGSENVALVKWAANTHFQRHGHPGGEEIFVLDGVFADEFGTYPQETWLRNPPGSIHTPFSANLVGVLSRRESRLRQKQTVREL
jgi:anti-sigma factor ChrR (cupin superfamily)